ALGRDINPVAVNAVRVALGPMPRGAIASAYAALEKGVGTRIRNLYRSTDSLGKPCDVLYYFWVMQVDCPSCNGAVDLFPSHVIAQNAYPKRRPEVQIVCPACGDIFQGLYGKKETVCPGCSHHFNQDDGSARGQKAICVHCQHSFPIIKAVAA